MHGLEALKGEPSMNLLHSLRNYHFPLAETMDLSTEGNLELLYPLLGAVSSVFL